MNCRQLVFIFCCIWGVACSKNGTVSTCICPEASPEQSVPVKDVSAKKEQTEPTAENQAIIEIDPLIEFAAEYEPTELNGKIPVLPTPTDEVREILMNYEVDNKFSISVTLVILKLHSFYLKKYNQSYDIRGDELSNKPINPFLDAFSRIARLNYKWEKEKNVIPTSIIEDWLQLHMNYLRSPQMNEEWEVIRAVHKKWDSEACTQRLNHTTK